MATRRRTGPSLTAFLSYAHADEKRHSGAITGLRQLLEDELSLQSGSNCQVFQDTKDIAPGELWRARLAEGLDGAPFLIPIVTPSFLNSRPCKAEVIEFNNLALAKGFPNRIIPIVIVAVPELNEADRVRRSKILSILSAHQWIDMTSLRFEDFDSSSNRRVVANLAERLLSSQARENGPHRQEHDDGTSDERTVPHLSTASAEGVTSPQNLATDERHPEATAPQTPDAVHDSRLQLERQDIVVVDTSGHGDYSTLDDALLGARPGTRLVVRPGVYRCDRPVTASIVIEGPPDRGAVIEASAGAALIVDSSGIVLKSLTIRRLGPADTDNDTRHYGLHVRGGRATIVDCSISSGSLSALGIDGDSQVRVVSSAVHDSNQSGIWCFESSIVEIIDCHISDNAGIGLKISATRPFRLRSPTSTATPMESMCRTTPSSRLRIVA